MNWVRKLVIFVSQIVRLCSSIERRSRMFRCRVLRIIALFFCRKTKMCSVDKEILWANRLNTDRKVCIFIFIEVQWTLCNWYNFQSVTDHAKHDTSRVILLCDDLPVRCVCAFCSDGESRDQDNYSTKKSVLASTVSVEASQHST